MFPTTARFISEPGLERRHERCQHGTTRQAGSCRACDEEAASFAEDDLTPEGIQLVIPGAERVQPASVKQGELF